jgi:hypothetical protein
VRLHIGLGPGVTRARVEIEWPTGKKQIKEAAACRTIEFIEDGP